MKFLNLLFLSLLVFGCNKPNKTSYAEVITPISKKTKVIELLSDNGKGRIAIAPEIQGKIVTTTFGGLTGESNGWINKSAIQGDELNIAKIGGEDRLWFGPLGSQHSFYFKQIKPLSEDNWSVPSSLSTEAYTLKKVLPKEVLLSKQMKLTNFIGTEFNFEVLRKIRLLEKEEINNNLNISLDENLDFVAYESLNSIENIGDVEWKKETGLVSLWSAGMFEGTDESVVIIPLNNEFSLDKVYKYLGDLDNERLQLKGNNLLFKVDGKYRSKIGIPHNIAPEVYCCYSKEKNRLTVVQYRKTSELHYSNSHVSVQENPYKGEIIPIYNDGPMDYSTTSETSFFELESISAMVELLPNTHIDHYHRVYHFSGNESQLNEIAKKLLGIKLADCVLTINN